MRSLRLKNLGVVPGMRLWGMGMAGLSSTSDQHGLGGGHTPAQGCQKQQISLKLEEVVFCRCRFGHHLHPGSGGP